MMTPFLSSLSDRLAAADPAYSRLRLASRAMLSLALAGGAVGAVAALHTMPVAAFGMTVVLCFIGSMAVRDTGRKAQLVTRIFGGLAAVGSALVAGLLVPYPLAADVAFLTIIFVSVYIRKFGMRWFAVGMMSFLAYFIADFLTPPPAEIGWVALAAGIALATTQIVTNHIMPDNPERDFRRAMLTIDHRINLILRAYLQYARAGSMPEDNRELMRHHVDRLREIVLMAEGFIPRPDNGLLAAGGPPLDLATALFDLQLAVERLVRARHTELPPPALLESALNEKGSRLLKAPDPDRADPDAGSAISRLLAGVLDERARINSTLGPSPSPAFSQPVIIEPADSQSKDAEAPQEDNAKRGLLVPLSLQRPIQVTIACGLALGAGLLLSPTRWFWAVITAYIVFNNTRSRADTATRAIQRSAGTLAGLFAGTVVATLFHGNIIASAVAIPVLFFLAFYFVQTSYGTMIFFVTIAIALLYGLMGVFNPQLLVVRLEETLVGAVAGTAVAFFVFPVRTSSGVKEALDAYLDSLGEFLGTVRDHIGGREPSADIRALSRAIDRQYSALSAAARPLGAPWNIVTRFGRVREKLLCLMATSLWARSLADTLHDGHVPDREGRAAMAATIDELDAEIGRARSSGPDLFLGRRSRVPPLDTTPPRMAPSLPEDEDFGYSLEAMRDLMRFANV